MQEITNKKFFINYAFFLLILSVLFGILIYATVLSRKSWNNNLSKSVQKVLDEYDQGTWTVNESIAINKPIGVNCAAYQIKNNKNNSSAKAIILRITTFYGPLPAVFIYNDDENISFAGFSSLHGRVRQEAESNKSDKRIKYWQSKIPEILK